MKIKTYMYHFNRRKLRTLLKELRSRKISGVQSLADSCPLHNLIEQELKEKTDFNPNIDDIIVRTDYVLIQKADWKVPKSFRLNDEAKYFIEQFDRGRFSEFDYYYKGEFYG